jgi:hypothetical protein
MQRNGLSSGVLPLRQECDEMLRLQTTVQVAFERIRNVIIAQEHAMAEQRSRDEASKTHSNSLSDDSSQYHDQEGGGGFAGGETKKVRRGVSLMNVFFGHYIDIRSEMHLPVVVIVVIEQKHLNGEEGLMERGHFVMHVDCVCLPVF